MIVVGISPLDKDATVSIVSDGEILYAAGEERFSRRKQHAGFPHDSLEAAFDLTGIQPEQIDSVAYAFLTWNRELASIDENLAAESNFLRGFRSRGVRALVAEAKGRISPRVTPMQPDRQSLVMI